MYSKDLSAIGRHESDRCVVGRIVSLGRAGRLYKLEGAVGPVTNPSASVSLVSKSMLFTVPQLIVQSPVLVFAPCQRILDAGVNVPISHFW